MSGIVTKLKKAIGDPGYRLDCLAWLGFFDRMPDEDYLRLAFRVKQGRELDLADPRTMNEKLQWLKLHDRRPEYPTMVDKAAAKDWAARRIGGEHIVPTLGVWEHFDQIDFDALPERFVLKCTHDSGSVVVVPDKSRLDREAARKKLEKGLKRNYFRVNREWPYKDVPPRILAEEYLESRGGERDGSGEPGQLTDYKIYCFQGQAKLMMIATDRFSSRQTRIDYFDRDFHWLDMTWGYPHSETAPPKPPLFEEMIAMAEKLAAGLPHVRVDLYVVDGWLYFGEMTFYDDSGFAKIEPPEWDLRLGSWLELPRIG